MLNVFNRYTVIYLSLMVYVFVFVYYLFGLVVLYFQSILLVHILVGLLVQGLLSVLKKSK